jgi:drug/metabolite transporter (DMT)-like permease
MAETHPPSHLWPGVPLALASAALFGATAPLAKVLLGVVDPQLLAGLLYLGAESAWLACISPAMP